MRHTFFSITLVVTLALPTFGQTRPTRIGGRNLDQLRSAFASLDLTDQQKTDIKSALTEARDQFLALRKNEDAGAARDQVMEDLKKRAAEILTPAQQQKVRQALGEPTETPTSKSPEKTVSADQQENTKPIKQNSPATAPTLIEIAQRAPNFTLSRSAGPNVSLSQFEGKVVLIVFGAYSSPTFRVHASHLEQLRRDYSSKLNEVVIYTKEPHAKEEWEIDRNKDIGIEITQAKTMAERSAAAKQMQGALKLTVPVVVDTIDNTTAGAYGAEADSAFLVGREGTILFRQKWFDPYGMHRAIDAALAEAK